MFKALSDRPADDRLYVRRKFFYKFVLIIFINSVLTVAGAGRGPLVARSLKAIERALRNVTIYAIEKNPNAYVTYVRSFGMFFRLPHNIHLFLGYNCGNRLNGRTR